LEDYLHRYSHIAAHIIAEFRGSITSYDAARILRCAREKRNDISNASEHDFQASRIQHWLEEPTYAGDLLKAVRVATKNRHIHNETDDLYPYYERHYLWANPELHPLYSASFETAYRRVRSAINTEEMYLEQFSRICRHIILQSGGKLTPIQAATVLKAFKERWDYEYYAYRPLERRDACDVLSERFGFNVRNLVNKAITKRHEHANYMTLYAQALKEGEEPSNNVRSIKD